MSQPKPDTAGAKVRVTITLDPDVVQALTDVAKAQRDSVSGMANRMLAVTLGLMPRREDALCRSEPH